MDDIKFYEISQIVEFFRGSKKLGYGREGACYKIKNMSYKFYNSLYREIYGEIEYQKQLTLFRNKMVDNIYFIRGLMFYGDKLMGSVTEYANGNSCGKIWLYKNNLDKLISALGILRKDIYHLSELGICVMDHDLSNVLYDGNVFSLIDVGEYYYSRDVIYMGDNVIVTDVDEIYKENMRKIICLLFEGITSAYGIYDKFVFAYLQAVNSPYKDYLEDIDLMLEPDDTIRGIRSEIQEGIGREITTFSSCRKDLQRIMKMR